METGEKRHFSRFAMDAAVSLTCESEQFESRLLDISLRGALVERPASWSRPVGSGCNLQIALNGGDLTLVMEGAIAHENSQVLGFRCDQIDLESISHLRRLVELNLGDERDLERELAELINQGGTPAD